jgi:hypothetical protein
VILVFYYFFSLLLVFALCFTFFFFCIYFLMCFSLAGLPSCVTPSLGYYRFGSRADQRLPEGISRVRAVSITGFTMGVLMRVRRGRFHVSAAAL